MNRVSEDSEWFNSFHIQRLQKPVITAPLPPNPFRFGAGGTGGGLSKESYWLLRQFVDFDYMGAAEYEFGALPRALASLWDKPDVKRWETEVGVVIESYMKREPPKKKSAAETRAMTLTVIGPESAREKIDNVLVGAAKGTYDLHNPIQFYLAERLLGGFEDDGRFIGGFEIDNGWWFFVPGAEAAAEGIEAIFNHMIVVEE